MMKTEQQLLIQDIVLALIWVGLLALLPISVIGWSVKLIGLILTFGCLLLLIGRWSWLCYLKQSETRIEELDFLPEVTHFHKIVDEGATGFKVLGVNDSSVILVERSFRSVKQARRALVKWQRQYPQLNTSIEAFLLNKKTS